MRYPMIRPIVFNPVAWLTVFLLLLNVAASAQQTQPESGDIVFTVVEHAPEFPGGMQEVRSYLQKNLVYPDSAAKAKIRAKVFVTFIVEADGSLTHVAALNRVGYGCDEEAVRVVQAMPRWQPGTQSGRAVRVKYNLPIAFGAK